MTAVREGMKFVSSQNRIDTIAEYFGSDVKLSLDVQLHNLISTKLKASAIGIISEEDQSSMGTVASLTDINQAWVIDPLDGSYNFVRGIPHCAISIALVEMGKPVLGVIGNLITGAIYSGGRHFPPKKNGNLLAKPVRGDYSESVLATGFPVGRETFKTRNLRQNELISRFGKVRMFGSAAVSLAFLAEGKVDCYYEDGIFLWDVAAGWAIAEELGANVTVSCFDNFRLELEVSASERLA